VNATIAIVVASTLHDCEAILDPEFCTNKKHFHQHQD
jgi:hypothetical protein